VSGRSSAAAVITAERERWRWPVSLNGYDRRDELTGGERDAVRQLGTVGLRRLGPHRDLDAAAWRTIGRLLRPLDDVNAALDHSNTFHQRRAALDAIAIVLMHCARTQRPFWSWTQSEWLALIGRTQPGSRTVTRTPGALSSMRTVPL